MMSPKWKCSGPVPFFLHRRSVDSEMWRRSAAWTSVKHTVPWDMGALQTTGFPLPSRKIGGLRRHVLRSQGGPAYVNSSLAGTTQTYKGTLGDFFQFLFAADHDGYYVVIVKYCQRRANTAGRSPARLRA